jgi:hypothetical protein
VGCGRAVVDGEPEQMSTAAGRDRHAEGWCSVAVGVREQLAEDDRGLANRAGGAPGQLTRGPVEEVGAELALGTGQCRLAEQHTA